MSDQPSTIEQQITEEGERITYNQLGFRSAAKSQSNPEAIEGYLEIVYDQFLEDEKLSEKGIKDRIAKIKGEVQQELTKKQDAIAALNVSKRNKEEMEKTIEELELEKIEIKNGSGETGDTTSFVIGMFITLLLTLYLFVFYSSSGYSAFYGIKPGSLGFINPNVFADASARGGGVIALIILFPVIFLGLGFLIHDSLQKNKILKKENKPRQFGLIVSLLIITLIADAFIGYKIAEGIHNNEFNAGQTTETWKFHMIYSDINFYLVLILGFVVYIIWGFLLHYVLSNPYLQTESERVKLLVENINNKLTERRKELTDIITAIHKSDSDIATCTNLIEAKQKDIIGYENGVIPVSISKLRGSVGEFMGGWQNYTHGNFTTNKAKHLVELSIKAQTNWLTNKIAGITLES